MTAHSRMVVFRTMDCCSVLRMETVAGDVSPRTKRICYAALLRISTALMFRRVAATSSSCDMRRKQVLLRLRRSIQPNSRAIFFSSLDVGSHFIQSSANEDFVRVVARGGHLQHVVLGG
jgi:hypothetical protein